MKMPQTLWAWIAAVVLASATQIARAQNPEVTFGASETTKSLALSRPQIMTSLQIHAKSLPMARVCDVPDGPSAVRAFVAANTGRSIATVRSKLVRLREFNVTNDGVLEGSIDVALWSEIGFPGSRPPNWWTDWSSNLHTVSPTDLAALNAGQPVTMALRSRCMAAPNFKAWLGEVARVLALYYQVPN